MPQSNKEPVNKSAAIRDMLAKHPKSPVKEIVSQLGKQGTRVRPTLVYYIRSKQRQQHRKEVRARVAETTKRTGAADPVTLVLQVKQLARDAGGLQNLKKLVEVLAE
jgi:hypothetical protein